MIKNYFLYAVMRFVIMKRSALLPALILAAVLLSFGSNIYAASSTRVNIETYDADEARDGIQLRAGQYLEVGMNFRITIGAEGIAPGGEISIRIPSGWTQANIYSGPGYSVASTTAPGVSLFTDITSSGTVILVKISTYSVPLVEGDVVCVSYAQPTVQWTAQDGVIFFTMVRASPAVNFTEVSPQPYVDVIAGPPANVSFETWGLTVKKDTPSSAIRLVLKDSNWITTRATSPVNVYLSGQCPGFYDTNTYMYIYPPDTTALFSSTSNFSSYINQITIPAGETGVSFYYKTSTAPYSVIQISYTLMEMTNFQTMWVSVITGDITNPSLSGGVLSDNNMTSTIGSDEGVYINFNLTDAQQVSWQVYVSSSPDRTTALWTYWGYGSPLYNQVWWNGRFSYWDTSTNQWRDEKAPNGTYYIRIQLGSGGGIYNDSLKVIIQSYEISGRVVESGTSNGIAGVSVNAYGPSYSYTVTDPSGYYLLGGLKAGSYYIDYYAPGYSREYKSGISAGANSVNVGLKRPAYLKINARRAMNSTIPNSEVWGGAQIYPSAAGGYYGGGYWASLHFDLNVSTSDNGQWSNASNKYEIDNSTIPWMGGKWSVLEVNPGTYTVRADLWGYVTATSNISVGSGEIKEVSLYFASKKNAYGVVTLPEAVADSWGAWVSLEAIKSGDTWSSAWGYASIPQGLSSGTFVISGLESGDYTIRAYAPGYRRASKSPVSIGASDEAVSVGEIPLSAAGGISGTITVEGDTLNDQSIQSSLWGDSTDNNPNFYIYINAWSPDAYSYGWTQVKVYKNASVSSSTFTIKGLDDGAYWVNSWLNGFQLENAVGWNGVRAVVSGGSGTLNLKFKRYSGRIKIALSVPGNDYENVALSINGNNLWVNDATLLNMASYGITPDTTTTAGIFYVTTPRLGNGFYQIKARYIPNGYEKTKNIMAVDGQTLEISIPLTARTYNVSGKVKISASNPPAGYSSIDVLLDSAAANNTFWINMYTSTNSLFVQAVDYTKMDTLSTPSGNTASHIGYVGRDGSFAITGLVPGVYVLQIPSLELDGNTENGKETAPIQSRVFLLKDTDVTGAELSVMKGYSIKGKLQLPSGEYATRDFYINVFDAKKYSMSGSLASSNGYIGGKNVSLVNANSADYEIKGLATGEYVLVVQDYGYWDANISGWIPRQYANASISVKVESSDVNGKNITLSRGGKITLTLRDADSGAVITPRNKDRMLPSSYGISAMANPWVDGGWATLDTISGGSGSEDKFTLNFLPEAIYDVTLGQSSYGMMMNMSTNSGAAGNQTNYAPKVITGINVKNNQTTDLGSVDIRQGLTITGEIKNKNGSPLPNIPVVAVPSLSNEWSSEIRTFTDINGKYSLVGLDPQNPYYDIIACPRIDPSYFGGYYFWGSGGLSYGEKVKSMVKISEWTNLSVDFTLEEARGSVTGKVVTSDGGFLQNPSDTNLPTARVFMQMEDTIPRTNPVGDIMTDTDIDGNFAIEALPPGTYRLTVISGGYGSSSRMVTISSGSASAVDLGTIELERGAQISGKITKPDGKYPSTTEIKGITAISEDMEEFLVGTLKKSGDKTVAGYDLYGFRSGVSYNIMFLVEGDEIAVARTGYTVPYSSYVKTNEDIIYRLAPPAVLVRARKIPGGNNNVFSVNFDLVGGSLRKSIPADDDLSSIITVVSGAGTLSEQYLSPSRKSISLKYTAPLQENKFALRLKAYSKTVNPETGTEFEIDESFEFYAGVSARNKVRVSNMRGGKITLEGDSSSVSFSANAFDGATSTTTVEVQFMKGDDVSEITSARAPASAVGTSGGKSARYFSIPRAPQAYPSRLYKAMDSLYRASRGAPSISPLSSFYDVMLPAGISRALKKDARLTIQYSTASVSSSDNPSSDYNIYYYDELNNVWLLQDKDKTVDPENGTITVSISHASVFTVIKSNAPVIRGASGVSEVFVYNFPNPFNLSAKDVTLEQSATPGQKRSVTGTMIHFGLPPGVSGDVEIRIYNVAGELVRTLKGSALGLDNLAADSHYYVEWDGKNDSAKEVASGVYIGRFTVGDGKYEKFFKMAVIK